MTLTRDGRQVVVHMGEFVVDEGAATLTTLGLGSCVALVLYDPAAGVGSLAHVLLPSRSLSRHEGAPARCADTAVPAVLEAMRRRGAVLERIVARLVGGATMFSDLLPVGSTHIGERNVHACREALRVAGVPVVAEAVGGSVGRSVWFDVGRGVVTVRSVGSDAGVL